MSQILLLWHASFKCPWVAQGGRNAQKPKVKQTQPQPEILEKEALGYGEKRWKPICKELKQFVSRQAKYLIYTIEKGWGGANVVLTGI